MPILKDRDIDSPISYEDIKRKIGQFENDLAYFESNQAKLVEKYNDEWVAIYNREVVAHAKHFLDLLGKLAKIGLSEEDTVTKYLSDSKLIALYLDK